MKLKTTGRLAIVLSGLMFTVGCWGGGRRSVQVQRKYPAAKAPKAGEIKPVPAGCVMRALDRLTPGAVTRQPNVDAAACGAYQRHSLDALSVAALKTIDAQFAASKTIGGLLGRIFG